MAKRTWKEKQDRRKPMSKEEQLLWDECYKYFRSNLLGYDENQALPKTIVLRLKGMMSGRFIENYDATSYGNYSFNVLLNTMKFCKPDVQRALNGKFFKDECGKMMYVCAIIENKLNCVYMRMKSAKKTNESIKLFQEDQSILENEIDFSDKIEQARKRKNKNLNSDLW